MNLLSTFDRVVWTVTVSLTLFIAATLLIGDRVGVRLVRVSPLAKAHSTDTILIEFSEQMNRATVEDRFSLQPSIDGAFTWSGDTMRFRPAKPLEPGDTYTVALEPGAASRSGRTTLSEFQFTFEVRQPQVVYLHPADGFPQNIWMADPANPTEPQQITFSQSGILDFAVSPDGRQIAFSERRSDRPASDIKRLNLDTGEVSPLTDCVDSDCSSPVWRPDGNMLAYTRVDMNTLLPGVGISPFRIWLLDLTTNPATTQPLFQNSQALGYGPQWSADGNRLSLFDTSVPGLVVYDFNTDETVVIESENGSFGALSPDGFNLVFPEVVLDQGRAWSQLLVAELDEQNIHGLAPEGEPVDDTFATWHPNGDRLAVGRRYRDDRFTQTIQLYSVNAENGESEPLIVDPRYNNGFVHWDPNGTALVLQRFQQFTDDGAQNRGGRPEIWTYHLESDTLTMIAENGMFPRWVP
jgi:Tol biopolymer transport system component